MYTARQIRAIADRLHTHCEAQSKLGEAHVICHDAVTALHALAAVVEHMEDLRGELNRLLRF